MEESKNEIVDESPTNKSFLSRFCKRKPTYSKTTPTSFPTIDFEKDHSEKILDFISNPDQYQVNLQQKRFDWSTPFMLCCEYQPSNVVLQMLDTFSSDKLQLNYINFNSSLLYRSAFEACCIYQSYNVITKMMDKLLELNVLHKFIGNGFCLCYTQRQSTDILFTMINLLKKHKFHFRFHYRNYVPPFVYCCIKTICCKHTQSSEILLKMIESFNAYDLGLDLIHRDTTPFMYCCMYASPNVILKMIETFTAKNLKLHYSIRPFANRSNFGKGMTAFMVCCIHQPSNVVLKMIERFTSQELNLLTRNRDENNVFKLCYYHQPYHVLEKLVEAFPIEVKIM